MSEQVFLASGLDPSGGAGFLADASVCRLLGVRPVGVLTASTVQDSQGVRRVVPTDVELLGEQALALLSDVEIKAAKIGALGNLEVTRCLSRALDLTSAPAVWDPVNRPSSGPVSLFQGESREALEELASHITVVTPNLFELGLLLGKKVEAEDAGKATQALGEQHGISVLLTGVREENEVVDWIYSEGELEPQRNTWVDGAEDVHGAGCALSTAVAAYLAKGLATPDACRSAVKWLHQQLPNAALPGRGAKAIV